MVLASVFAILIVSKARVSSMRVSVVVVCLDLQ
jgi:hypothetical protein